MSKHTPGPWIPLKGIFWSVENEDGYRIASLVESENIGLPPNDDSQANANLIAAAPDLLEALVSLTEDAFPQFTGGCVGTFDIRKGAYEAALAAIARAKGESS